jgi:hypothetical protein
MSNYCLESSTLHVLCRCSTKKEQEKEKKEKKHQGGGSEDVDIGGGGGLECFAAGAEVSPVLPIADVEDALRLCSR